MSRSCTYEHSPTGTASDGGASVGVAHAWSCPHDAHGESDRCLFHLSAAEREDRGLDEESVVGAIRRDVIGADDGERKRLYGAELPRLELGYRTVSGANRYPVEFRDCDLEALVVDHADVALPLDLSGSDVGALLADEAVFEENVRARGATFGEAAGFEARFEGDADFEDAVFAGEADFDEGEFVDDTRFAGARFEGTASFRGAEFAGGSNLLEDNASFAGATFEGEALFDHAHFSYTTFEGAAFGAGAHFEDAAFDGDAVFTEAVYEGPADFDEVRFVGDTSFEHARFGGPAVFRGLEDEGGANVLEDDLTFANATFEVNADFRNADLEYVSFERAEIEGHATFEGTRFRGDAHLDGVRFGATAGFDETTFAGDAEFGDAEFGSDLSFVEARFTGSTTGLAEADFREATFRGEVTFERCEFVRATFEEAAFAGEADFERSRFADEATFERAAFAREADFDEARFDGDAEFSDANFSGDAVFRGAEMLGETRHLADSARFRRVAFEGDADFDNVAFRSADFREATFRGTIDFSESTFGERVHMSARSVGDQTYVNLTRAHVESGEIGQPDEGWVRYDLTRATLGDVEFDGDDGTHRLFHYLRFCETTFEDFDFAAHRPFLERNDWFLHDFDEGEADYEFAVDMSPDVVERTYLSAYQCAKAQGDGDAAIEFAIKQAIYRRKKNLAYAADPSLPVGSRVAKSIDVVGNYLWYATCGYGYRLWRILAASAFVIVTWGLIFALPVPGTEMTAEKITSLDQVLTPGGLELLRQYQYYSVVTFTTVGYGDINPVGPVARALAATEGVLGVLLAALVVFVLGRRVAI